MTGDNIAAAAEAITALKFGVGLFKPQQQFHREEEMTMTSLPKFRLLRSQRLQPMVRKHDDPNCGSPCG